MPKYINADELKVSLLNLADRTEEWEDTGMGIGIRFAINALDSMPSADVRENKHGEWISLGGGEWVCSECGNVIFAGGSWIKPYDRDFFCNKCGADMRKRKEEK